MTKENGKEMLSRDDYSRLFSIKLKDLKDSKDISTRELAELMDVSESSIRYFKRGERLPNIYNIYRLHFLKKDIRAEELIVLREPQPVFRKKRSNGMTESEMNRYLSDMINNMSVEDKTFLVTIIKRMSWKRKQ